MIKPQFRQIPDKAGENYKIHDHETWPKQRKLAYKVFQLEATLILIKSENLSGILFSLILSGSD
jgi:hypothetical protein